MVKSKLGSGTLLNAKLQKKICICCSDGKKGSSSFSVNLCGEEDAFELAVYCRRKGLRELGFPSAYF
jgi:hypothetical protein